MVVKAVEIQRLNQANELLKVIASCGRKFFSHKGSISEFTMRANGRVWYRDHYTKKWLYTHRPYMPWGFTNGGTLDSLIIRLRKFIKDAEPLKLPAPDHWGYGDEMQVVKEKVAEMNASLGLSTTATPTSDSRDINT